MEIKIVKASKEDIQTIVDFQLKMALETEELELDPVILKKGVTAVIDDSSKASYFIAKVSCTNSPSGSASSAASPTASSSASPTTSLSSTERAEEVAAGMLMITLEWSDWRNGWVWWIQSVYVDREFRKYGVFKELYNHIKSIVESSENIRGIRLYVDKRNTRAQKVYESLGMTGEHYSTYEWMKG